MRISPAVRELRPRPEEILIHVDPLACPPIFPCRNLPRLPPCLTVARSPYPMSPLPQPRGPYLGHLSLPARVQALPVHPLSAHLRRWDADHVVAARNASPAGAITIKIGRR